MTALLDLSPTAAAPRPTRVRFYQTAIFWAYVAVAMGVAWRTVRYLLQFPIWGDESFVCVNFLDAGYADLIGPLRVGQICPLTFLWSELAIYHWLGPAEWVLRLLPFLAGLASLALFWALCRRVLPPVGASLALALLAVSYYPVRHSVEVKPYSEDLLVTLGLLLPAVLYVRNPERIRWLVLLAAIVPLAVVSSYPAVLVAGAVAIVLLPIVWGARSYRAKAWFVTFNLLLVVTFCGNYFLIGKPQLSPHLGNPNNAFNSTWHEWFPERDPLSLLWWFFKANTGNMLAYPIGGPNFASSLTTLFCVIGAWSWWRGGNRRMLGLLLWPFALSVVAGMLHKYPYGGSARLDQHLAPAICLLMANGLITVARRWSPNSVGERRASVLVALLLAAFGAAGLIRDIVKPFKTTAELWNRNFVEDLLQRVSPNDRVVIFHAPSEIRPGLEWYFRQHDDRVYWRGDLGAARALTGKTWCVEIHAKKPSLDPILAAVGDRGQALSQVGYYQSLAPPEHGDDPELAEVYCFVGRPPSAND